MDEYSLRLAGVWRWLLTAVLLATTLITLIPAVRHWRERPDPPPRPLRAGWIPPADLTIGAGAMHPFGAALAPDGRRVAFPAARDGRVQLWIQDLSNGEVTDVPGSDRAVLPFWSPDGTGLGFFADGALKAMRLADRRAIDLAAVQLPRGGSWNADDAIVYTNDEDGLSITRWPPATTVSGDGRPQDSRVLTAPDAGAGERGILFPAFAGNGSHLVALVQADQVSRQGLYLVAASDGARTRLTGAAASAVPAAGQLLFANSGSLMRQDLDLDAGRLTGRPELLAVRVGSSPAGQLLATAGGDALLFSEPVVSAQELVWYSREGERTGTIGAAGDYGQVRIAPDGRRVAVTTLEPLLQTLDVVQFDGRALMPSRVSLSIDTDDWPAWSPDGLRVAWVQGGRAVMVRGAGAVLPAETLTRFDDPVRVSSWTPDGSALIVSRPMPGTREDLWLVPVRGGGAPRPLVSTPFADIQGVLSPDGRHVAYASDESGRFEVYVEAVMDRSPGPATRERVSSGGGSDPRWSRDGQELFFRRESEIHVAVPASGRGQNAVATTSIVFRTEVAARSFDVAPDGRRFLLSLPAAAPPPPATLILYWRQPPKVTTTGP